MTSLWVDVDISLLKKEHTALEALSHERNTTVGNIIYSYIKAGLEQEGKRDLATSYLTVSGREVQKKAQILGALQIIQSSASKAALLIPESLTYEERLTHEADQKILQAALVIMRKVHGLAPGE